MKKILSIIGAMALGLGTSQAQCSQVLNDFELKLVPKQNKTLEILIRHNKGTVEQAVSSTPSKELLLDGLIFAIAYPSSSNIEFTNCVSKEKPFNVIIDKDVQAATNKVASEDKFQTFVNTSEMPEAFPTDWKDGEWHNVATISYNGNLGKGQFFSLLTCDYGLAHPNAYYGNSHTDPWFAILDKNFSYMQYSPKMITELPTEINATASFNVYPNPTTEEFNVTVECNTASSVLVQLSDLKGAVVKTQNEIVEAGTTSFKLNVKELAPGNYFLKIADGKVMNLIQKVQIQ
jgi:hypothetical protein